MQYANSKFRHLSLHLTCIKPQQWTWILTSRVLQRKVLARFMTGTLPARSKRQKNTCVSINCRISGDIRRHLHRHSCLLHSFVTMPANYGAQKNMSEICQHIGIQTMFRKSVNFWSAGDTMPNRYSIIPLATHYVPYLSREINRGRLYYTDHFKTHPSIISNWF